MTDLALFSIETNVGFEQKPYQSEKIPVQVLSSFQLPAPHRVRSIEKHNLFSNIFICEFGSETIAFRVTDASARGLLEKQCEVFASLPEGVVLQPLKNTDDKFVSIDTDLAWIAYPYVEGALFEGEPDKVLPVFQRCLQVTHLLGSIGDQFSAEEKQLFPQVELNPVSWKSALDTLVNGMDDPMSVALGNDLHSFLVANNETLVALVEDLSSKRLPGASLVHYDLQHANVVMSNTGPTVIDLEDIYYAPLQVAIGYCAFKLARHVVFSDPALKPIVISDIIPKMSVMLESAGIESRSELFDFSAIRTLNDIAYIFHLYFDKGKDFVLYDLRKKVLNLLESAVLTGYPERVGLR